mmetsp:Transcript_121083/g.343054  ORF Transcript_121083/g.343054 Transcript_121083/m.343054 type:complete len:410 (-) Transcript_121083:439-1668(-)
MEAPLLLEQPGRQRRACGVKVAVAAVLAVSGVAFLGGVGLQPKPSPPMPSLQSMAATSLVAKDPPGGFGAPRAKAIVLGMDTNVNFHIAWNNWKPWSKEMAPYWTKDMVYDFAYVGEWGFGRSKGLRGWYEAEHLHYNAAIPDCQWTDFIRAATDETCTSASYGPGRWIGEFAGVPPPPEHPWVVVHDLDFYLLEGDRIKINWCIIDVVNLFDQVGYHTLPPAPMPMDGYMPARAMDGVPAPLSAMVDPRATARSEAVWRAALQEDFWNASDEASFWADDMVWYGPGGIGTAHSRRDYREHFLAPLHAAFSNIEIQEDMVVCEGAYCGCHFYVYGTHTGTWLGEEPTGKRVPLRMGAHARVVGGKIAEGWLLMDIPLAFKYMGVDLYGRARKQALRLAALGRAGRLPGK